MFLWNRVITLTEAYTYISFILCIYETKLFIIFMKSFVWHQWIHQQIRSKCKILHFSDFFQSLDSRSHFQCIWNWKQFKIWILKNWDKREFNLIEQQFRFLTFQLFYFLNANSRNANFSLTSIVNVSGIKSRYNPNRKDIHYFLMEYSWSWWHLHLKLIVYVPLKSGREIFLNTSGWSGVQ